MTTRMGTGPLLDLERQRLIDLRWPKFPRTAGPRDPERGCMSLPTLKADAESNLAATEPYRLEQQVGHLLRRAHQRATAAKSGQTGDAAASGRAPVDADKRDVAHELREDLERRQRQRDERDRER